ncbi:unnamed protein product, partial [Didymodactylos carnosus]
TALIVAYLNVQIPLELGNLINVVSSLLYTNQNNTSPQTIKDILYQPTVKLIKLYIYQALATFEYITLLSIAGERIASSIRHDLFQNILCLDIEFFDKTKTGEIMDRLTSDVQEFKSSFKLLISQGMRAGTQVSKSTAIAYEAIGNIRTTRAFGMESKEHQLFKDEVDKSTDMNIKLGLGIGIFQGLNNLVMNGKFSNFRF